MGHYCKICGERKANEKFSGKGHAAHICKACSRLSVIQRNELQRLTRIQHGRSDFNCHQTAFKVYQPNIQEIS